MQHHSINCCMKISQLIVEYSTSNRNTPQVIMWKHVSPSQHQYVLCCCLLKLQLFSDFQLPACFQQQILYSPHKHTHFQIKPCVFRTLEIFLSMCYTNLRLTYLFRWQANLASINSGVVIGGRRGGRPERHMLKGGTLRELLKIYCVREIK